MIDKTLKALAEAAARLEPRTYMVLSPGTYTGPTESQFEHAFAIARKLPPGTAIVELYTAEDFAPLRDQHAAEVAAKDARIAELENLAGLGCDAADRGPHSIMTDGRYRFCTKCGETITQPSLRERARKAERSLAEANARIKELEEERDAANDRTVKMIETVQRMRRAGEDLAVRLRAALAGTDTLKPFPHAEPAHGRD